MKSYKMKQLLDSIFPSRGKEIRTLANESARHAYAVTKVSAAAISRRWLLGSLPSDTTRIQTNAYASTMPFGIITDTAAGAGEYVAVELLGATPGTIRAVAAGAIAAGVCVYAAASGKVQTLPSSQGDYWHIGYSITAAAALNDELEIVTCVPKKVTIAGVI